MKFLGKCFLWVWLLSGLVACGVDGGLPAGESVPAEDTEAAARVVTEAEVATAEATAPAPTFTATLTPKPSATNTLVPSPTASATAATTARPTQTFTPSPTAVPAVKVQEDLGQSVNVRAGPGTDFALVGTLAPGTMSPVTGRNETGSWWQIVLEDESDSEVEGWIFADLVTLEPGEAEVAVIAAEELPTPPPAVPASEAVTETTESDPPPSAEAGAEAPLAPAEVAEQLKCGKDFCVTYQAMVPIWENGGCIGNHSIYITVLQGLPPGEPMNGVVIGDTFGNVEVGSGSHGPGRTEITLWNNSMTLVAKRHQDGTEYTSEESFNFTAHDELIPAEVLAANGYCEGRVDICEQARNSNQVCRGHYSWRVTFHKLE